MDTRPAYTAPLRCARCGATLHHQHRVPGYTLGAYCCPVHGPQADGAQHLRRLIAARQASRAVREAIVHANLLAAPEPTLAQVAEAGYLFLIKEA